MTDKLKCCSKCGLYKSSDEFYKYKRSPDGLRSRCKQCSNAADQHFRQEHRDRYAQYRKTRRKTNVQQIQDWKQNNGCKLCGERFPQCLELHHLDPSEKEHTPSELAHYSFAKFLKEAEKCVLVCANCHRKIHYGNIILIGSVYR